MATYVLVHGAWHGAWVWRDVANRLRGMGHEVTAPTLTGQGQRRHLAAPDVDLDTHVTDVISHIELEDLTDIVLVGWSYGGMVISDIVARMPERIAALVYLDAFVPTRGKCLNDYSQPAVRALIEAARERGEDIPIRSPEQFAVSDPDVAEFARKRITAQPTGPMVQPSKALEVHSPHIPRTYVRATAYSPSVFDQFYQALKDDPDWRMETVHSSHLLMMEKPEEVAEVLDRAGKA